MNEVEVKILEIDVEKTKQKLESLGAVKKFDGPVKSVYYILDDKRLLRIRKLGEKTIVTYKKQLPAVETKTAEEHETRVDDFDKVKKIFDALGYRAKDLDEKYRVSYSLDDASIEIDSREGVPSFLEIEAQTEKKLKEIVEKLGFRMEDTKPWSGKDVLKHYGI